MIVIYTDGSCQGNPGPGGYGVAAIVEDTGEILYSENNHYEFTTNNRQELTAILVALEWAEENYPNKNITIYSDSAYCVNAINIWMWNWAKNGWLTIKKEPIKNDDIIKDIYHHFNQEFYPITVEKVSGHSHNLGNEYVDALATDNQYKIDKYSTYHIIDGKLKRFLRDPDIVEWYQVED